MVLTMVINQYRTIVVVPTRTLTNPGGSSPRATAVARTTGHFAVSHFPWKVKLLPHVNRNRSTEIPMLVEGT